MFGQINKLFLIGNGFDLAHGLKTQYKHFIDNFWESEKTKILTSNQYSPTNYDNSHIYEDDILQIHTPKKIPTLPEDYISQNAKGYEWFKCLVSNAVSSKYTFVGSRSSKVEISIKNTFLQHISEKTYLLNWVDIESEYYYVLKNCFKILNEDSKKSNYTVDELNKDFEDIRNFLEKYLMSIENNRIEKNTEILRKFKAIIQPDLFSKNDKLNNKDNILFLSFNYTNTENEYISYFKNEIPQNIYSIHIHGKLNDKKNPIIFGYGDELDVDYLKIENSDDDRYLKNIKSIKYLQTPNYRELLKFIESYRYNVYIMGHSCGMSDRTLLNTIFENKNCSSIKVFYHQREDGTDDHNEKIMNISRNFKDKPSMRAKVIDKTNCESLV